MLTKVDEIADRIFRLSTFVPEIGPPAGFTFNQFLVLGDEPLLFHTGLRRMFPLLRDALARVIAPERLRVNSHCSALWYSVSICSFDSLSVIACCYLRLRLRRPDCVKTSCAHQPLPAHSRSPTHKG